jgi:O-antigen/teichoic acid export membrane protein
VTRVRSNTLAMAGTFLVQACFVFLQIKILTHWLTPGQFGLFASVYALGALLGSVAELGFSVVLVRYGAKFDAEGRLAALADLLKLAILLWLGAGLVIGLLLVLSAGPLAPRLGRPGVTAALLGLGFFAVLSFALRAFASAAFQGRRRMMPALGLDVCYMVGLTVLFLVFRERLSAAAVFWCFLGWSVAVGVGGVTLFLRGAGGSLRRGLRLVPEIRAYWGGAMATTIVAIALENADRLVLAMMLPFEAVASWHVAARISLFARKILFVPQQVAKPELAFKWEQGAADRVRADLALFSKLEWVLGLLIAVPVVLGARSGIVLASDARYLAAEPALVALAGALPILCLQAPLTTFLRASGHIWISVTGEFIWLLAFLVAGAALLPVAGLGGFALGQMIAATLTLLYTVWSLRRKGLPRPDLRFLAAHGLLAVALWGAAALLVRARPIDNVAVALAASLLFGLLLNAVLVWIRYFTPAEEARLLGLLGSGSWSRLGRALFAWPRFQRGVSR